MLRLFRPQLAFASLSLLSYFVTPLAYAAPDFEQETEQALDQHVLPTFEQRCLDCHDDDNAKGDVNLAKLFDPKEPLRQDIRLWLKIREQIKAGTMPPPTKPVLEEDAKKKIVEWSFKNEARMLARNPSDPGLRKTRRLTRQEYNLTLKDLLGIASKPADKFPADGAGGEGFNNNSDTLMFSPILMEKYIEAADAVIEEVWKTPGLRDRLMAPVTSNTLPPEVGAKLAIEPFLFRAYRRPVQNQDLEAALKVFRTTFERVKDWDHAMKISFKAILMSPNFLFLEEARKPEGEAPWKINSFELANRLSYFLWSSMPDQTLFDLAKNKTLHDPKVLEAQVKRMLKDPKSEALTTIFAAQWLRFDELFNSVDPDRRRFPEFNDQVRRGLYEEIRMFSDKILRENGNILDFLDSDYSYLNESIAKIYGIEEVKGPEFRKVVFKDKNRGGVIGMGAVHAITSYPRRTSPVLRGKWVLEQLIGTPPPPPPPNVGGLPEDDKVFVDGTFRQRLEAHRSKPACAGCHVKMDPLGFGMENFNNIGQWRDQLNDKPIDSSGTLPGNLQFNGPEQMRKVLLQEKDLYVRTFISRLLGYALNHGLEIQDQPTLLRLEKVAKDQGYRAEPIIQAMVQSYPFLHRK